MKAKSCCQYRLVLVVVLSFKKKTLKHKEKQFLRKVLALRSSLKKLGFLNSNHIVLLTSHIIKNN